MESVKWYFFDLLAKHYCSVIRPTGTNWPCYCNNKNYNATYLGFTNRLGCHWELPSDILVEWNKLLGNIPHLANLKIRRNLFSRRHFINLNMHGFADASLKAYGACIYVRAVYNDKTVSCTLVSTKSRIAPLKTISLPRLELPSKMTERILTIFKNRSFTFHSVNLWEFAQFPAVGQFLCQTWCLKYSN